MYEIRSSKTRPEDKDLTMDTRLRKVSSAMAVIRRDSEASKRAFSPRTSLPRSILDSARARTSHSARNTLNITEQDEDPEDKYDLPQSESLICDPKLEPVVGHLLFRMIVILKLKI